MWYVFETCIVRIPAYSHIVIHYFIHSHLNEFLGLSIHNNSYRSICLYVISKAPSYGTKIWNSVQYKGSWVRPKNWVRKGKAVPVKLIFRGPCVKPLLLIILTSSISLYPNQKGPPLWSSGQRSWLQIQRSGFDSRRYYIFFWEVVGLEREPLSHVIIIEELFQGNSGSGLENRN
jgi:hypothetical protein